MKNLLLLGLLGVFVAALSGCASELDIYGPGYYDGPYYYDGGFWGGGWWGGGHHHHHH